MPEEKKKAATGPYVQMVREVFEILALDKEESQLQYEKFRDPLSKEGGYVELPCDGDRPASDDLAAYIAKQMEYVQTFLVGARLGRELKIPPLAPPGLDIQTQIERIGSMLGAATN